MHVWDAADARVFCGRLNNAGKTTTLYKLMLGEVIVTQPTIGSNVEEVTYKNIKFQMWDIGGQESLRSSWSTYYQNATVRRRPSVCWDSEQVLTG